MNYSVSIHNFGDFADVRRLVKLAKEAEDNGWDGFFLWDHIHWNGPPMLDPWVALAAIASATSRIRPLLRLAALGGWILLVCTLHHGHVILFLEQVYELVEARLGRRFSERRWERRPSMIQLYFDDLSVYYEASVRRKTRSIEVGLHFEGERERNERWAELLAERLVGIQSQLGPTAELEQWTRESIRLHEQHVVNKDEWKPKRDLTRELAHRVA